MNFNRKVIKNMKNSQEYMVGQGMLKFACMNLTVVIH